jgi:hypothetical protein
VIVLDIETDRKASQIWCVCAPVTRAGEHACLDFSRRLAAVR